MEKKRPKKQQIAEGVEFTNCLYLTQCARIRVPVVSMKIEKFKDLFRAALDRW